MQKYISIAEAAKVTGKSELTIRRGVKANQFLYKKEKTERGFKYWVDYNTLISFYHINDNTDDKFSSFAVIEFFKEQLKEKDEQINRLQQLLAMEKQANQKLLESNTKQSRGFLSFFFK